MLVIGDDRSVFGISEEFSDPWVGCLHGDVARPVIEVQATDLALSKSGIDGFRGNVADKRLVRTDDDGPQDAVHLDVGIEDRLVLPDCAQGVENLLEGLWSGDRAFAVHGVGATRVFEAVFDALVIFLGVQHSRWSKGVGHIHDNSIELLCLASNVGAAVTDKYLGPGIIKGPVANFW